MSQFLRIALLASFCALPGMGGTAEAQVEKSRRVMTWVPPYGIAGAKARLKESFDGAGMARGITHLGLQFWTPTREGGVELVKRFKGVNEAEVAEFRKWAKAHGVRPMLCVYNGSAGGWDWELATAAFDTHRAAFVDALVKETLRLKLDGVDIDLEGEGDLSASKDAFVRFIKELSGRLHAERKELTVDTFAYKWHAPNQSWWPELLPHLDGLHVMGYSETGANATGWRSYAFLKAAAGAHSSKLLLGMPAHVARWQEAPVLDHVRWVVDDGSVGLALWDARLSDPAWRTRELWSAMERIRGTGEDRR